MVATATTAATRTTNVARAMFTQVLGPPLGARSQAVLSSRPCTTRA